MPPFLVPAPHHHLANELREWLSSEAVVRVDAPLAGRTTLGVGGAADLLVEPATECDLSAALRFSSERRLPWRVLGRGSNLLVRDGGYRGLMLLLAGDWFTRVETAGPLLHCGAGARLKAVAGRAGRDGLAGLEFLEGIPGSVGGALRMNAGAHGSWMFDAVETVRYADATGGIAEIPASELPARYRGCDFFSERVAVSAVLRGQPDDSCAIRERMEAYARQRRTTQPRDPSAGCIFKNPTSIPAGRLVEELGLKGFHLGGACVSTIHGNFIVNAGGATAGEVLQLIELVQNRAAEAGVDLETEVEIIGEAPTST